MEMFNFAVLQNLLASDFTSLLTRRALTCVNKLGHTVTEEHLQQEELYVNSGDCTATNARWILRRLMARVPNLRLCVHGEVFAPKMALKKLAMCNCVCIGDANCWMSPTAAFFLGHALAESETDCYVRLTTGGKKRIRALRENPRVYLAPSETFNEVDQRVMSGALLANAERRIDRLRLGDCPINLSLLEIDDRAVIDLGKRLRFAIREYGALPSSLDLSLNNFGLCGIYALLEGSYGPNGVVAHGSVMNELNLTGVSLNCAGVTQLAEFMAGGRLAVRDLRLARVNMGQNGMKALVDAHAQLAQRDMGVLEHLDVSHNPLTSRGLEPLLEVGVLPRLKSLNLRNVKARELFLTKLGTAIAKHDHFPSIVSIDHDTFKSGFTVPLHHAVSIASTKRRLKESEDDWDAWKRQNALDVAQQRETARERREVKHAIALQKKTKRYQRRSSNFSHSRPPASDSDGE